MVNGFVLMIVVINRFLYAGCFLCVINKKAKQIIDQLYLFQTYWRLHNKFTTSPLIS